MNYRTSGVLAKLSPVALLILQILLQAVGDGFVIGRSL